MKQNSNKLLFVLTKKKQNEILIEIDKVLNIVFNRHQG